MIKNDFDFEIVDFSFLDGDDPRSTSYGDYISHLIRFAIAIRNIIISAMGYPC